MIDVSVIVLTYNPKLDKVLKTLDSIISQEGVNIQIVLADDGSVCNHFSEIKQYMIEKKFENYKLMKSNTNVGTVKNAFYAVTECKYEYVKIISPGDCILTKKTMLKWVEHLDESKKDWSFGDAIYYREDNGRKISVKANPQNVDCYIKKKDKECIWNYVVLNDIVLGATMLCKKNVLQEYLSIIVDKVKYAEDNIFRIMMFDGKIPDYMPENVIMYEYGVGISTSGSSTWLNKLNEDWNATNEIIYSRAQNTFQKEIIKQMQIKKIKNKIKRTYMICKQKGKIKIYLKKLILPRMTNI